MACIGMAEQTNVNVGRVKAFWEQNPVAAAAISVEHGATACFRNLNVKAVKPSS